MEFLQQSFNVRFEYKVFFTSHLFNLSNDLFREFLNSQRDEGIIKKILFIVDEGVAAHHPLLQEQIKEYWNGEPSVSLAAIINTTGGEAAKNSHDKFHDVIAAINNYGIDRHSYVAAIGGGSVLDLVGYAAAVSHRGIRHIRIPTTVLSQNDSGVGVKNGINCFGKKNFLGTFSPPIAVFNDAHFLTTLSERDWRSGIAEAVKVALIKDRSFFHWLEENAEAMVARNMEAMQYQIKRCATLHLQHIASRDPFETGSSRPLDFGHWSAHKLEQMSDFAIRHGEAVAMGIALDSTYSYVLGKLSKHDLLRILKLLDALGFTLTHPLVDASDANSPMLRGLNEFREHLGGKLTIMLLKSIGEGEEVHEMDTELIRKASNWLHEFSVERKQS